MRRWIHYLVANNFFITTPLPVLVICNTSATIFNFYSLQPKKKQLIKFNTKAQNIDKTKKHINNMGGNRAPITDIMTFVDSQ